MTTDANTIQPEEIPGDDGIEFILHPFQPRFRYENQNDAGQDPVFLALASDPLVLSILRDAQSSDKKFIRLQA